jgi:hypothetical protein
MIKDVVVRYGLLGIATGRKFVCVAGSSENACGRIFLKIVVTLRHVRFMINALAVEGGCCQVVISGFRSPKAVHTT